MLTDGAAPTSPEVWTAERLAVMLGVTEQTLRRWRLTYGLPAFCVGRAVIVRSDEFFSWLEQFRETIPGDEAAVPEAAP